MQYKQCIINSVIKPQIINDIMDGVYIHNALEMKPKKKKITKHR